MVLGGLAVCSSSMFCRMVAGLFHRICRKCTHTYFFDALCVELAMYSFTFSGSKMLVSLAILRSSDLWFISSLLFCNLPFSFKAVKVCSIAWVVLSTGRAKI